jgi:hypothetical protein
MNDLAYNGETKYPADKNNIPSMPGDFLFLGIFIFLGITVCIAVLFAFYELGYMGYVKWFVLTPSHKKIMVASAEFDLPRMPVYEFTEKPAEVKALDKYGEQITYFLDTKARKRLLQIKETWAKDVAASKQRHEEVDNELAAQWKIKATRLINKYAWLSSACKHIQYVNDLKAVEPDDCIEHLSSNDYASQFTMHYSNMSGYIRWSN